MPSQMIYFFGDGAAEGDGTMKPLLGGKGAGLAEMNRIGVPVPPGFTITTDVCLAYRSLGSAYPDDLQPQIDAALARVEAAIGSQFGSADTPLLVSVRSGAAASMPGMMDTVLNVGLNDTTVEGLSKASGNPRFAYDSYRRFIQMYGNVVLGVDHFYFEEELYTIKSKAGVKEDVDLDETHLKMLVAAYKKMIPEHSDVPFPEDPRDQLDAAIRAVFDSWDTERAVHYRKLEGISNDGGTAVNIQAMVYGNLGTTSATGVAFTRNPSTGVHEFYGEFLPNAQGEDVVAGIRTPLPLCSIGEHAAQSLETTMPEAFAELQTIQAKLERHYRDMQDIEFTIQNGRVWLLQTRSGKRTTAAAVQIAVDMANEGLITRDEALLRVPAERISRLLHPTLDPDAPRNVVAKGLPASPGAATGAIVLTSEEAEAAAADGRQVILVRLETSPQDIKGMSSAEGILTAHGGMTSHAAVVARQMGRCCVVGCGSLTVDMRTREVTIGSVPFVPGDVITLDGATGEVMAGEIPRVAPQLSGAYETLMTWADEVRRIRVHTNADRGVDATLARTFGAEGIGLVRTEHMFFEGERINSMRETIMATNAESRRTALTKLLPFQRADFEGIFEAMNGLPVTIRLLDPPLHEFLPDRDEDMADLSERMGISVDDVRRRAGQLHEANPMLGHRGCRLAVTYPEIYDMQVHAIFEAATNILDAGGDARPEIMVPLVSLAEELRWLRARIVAIRDVYAQKHPKLGATPIGTMIELPRACAMADKIAEHADFLSFGTNDLTQTVFGFSRDDASSFVPAYIDAGILAADPFSVLDTDGVGDFIKMACRKARSVKPDIKIGICGEHGGEPQSVAWIQRGLVDYVSCSPYRVPIARLAAAQATIRDRSAN